MEASATIAEKSKTAIADTMSRARKNYSASVVDESKRAGFR